MLKEKILYEVTKVDKDLVTAELVCTKSDRKTKYDFNLFTSLLKYAEKIYTWWAYITGNKRWSSAIRNINKQIG